MTNIKFLSSDSGARGNYVITKEGIQKKYLISKFSNSDSGVRGNHGITKE